MPIILLHGEQLAKSRLRLVEVMNQLKAAGNEVVRWPANDLDLAALEQALGEASLFGTPKAIVIEELHSLPKSARKTELIDAIALAATNPDAPQLVLWEKRSLTKPMLKAFASAKVEEFKVSNTMFTWLDSVSGDAGTKAHQLKLLHQALAAEDAFFCFTMLCRQIRLLIQAKDGGMIAGPPFMVGKLKKQAQSFTMAQLLTTHHRLLELDIKYKSSNQPLTLGEQLDLLVVHL